MQKMNKDENFFPHAFLADKFVKTKDANISIMSKVVQYGMGVFAGIRGYYNEKEKYLSIFRIDDHYKRFLNSLKILGVALPYSKQQLKDFTITLAKKNKPRTDSYFRPFAYSSMTTLAPNLEEDKIFAFSLYMIPLGEYLPVDTGLSAKVSSWQRVNDNTIPPRAKISGAYINSALARKEANENGYNEAISLTSDGHVSEGSAENLFIVRDGVLITSPPSADILEGITRRTVLKIACENNIPTEERTIDRTELYVADEAFFSGTGCQVAWIQTIDKRKIGTGKKGPITAKLQDLYFDIVKGNIDAHKEWRTIVKY